MFTGFWKHTFKIPKDSCLWMLVTDIHTVLAVHQLFWYFRDHPQTPNYHHYFERCLLFCERASFHRVVGRKGRAGSHGVRCSLWHCEVDWVPWGQRVLLCCVSLSPSPKATGPLWSRKKGKGVMEGGRGSKEEREREKRKNKAIKKKPLYVS